MSDWVRVAAAALACAAVGLVFYNLQSSTDHVMNLWGVVSFAAIGASLGCLASSPETSRLFDFLRGWF